MKNFKELDKRNVLKKLRTDKEIFYKLLETSKTFSYMNLIKLFINPSNSSAVILSLFRSKSSSIIK